MLGTSQLESSSVKGLEPWPRKKGPGVASAISRAPRALAGKMVLGKVTCHVRKKKSKDICYHYAQ